MLIPLDYLLKKYKLKPEGVLHIGASTGQELEAYLQAGIKNIIFVEAIKEVFEKLCENIKRHPGVMAVNACISDKDGEEVEFNISSNNGESSSFLEFGTHSEVHPDVVFVDKVKMKTRRIDTLLKGANYDFLNIDLQGAELLALKGMGADLKKVKAVYIEVNKQELYKGCALVGEIDEYLSGFGLKRVETKWTGAGWGDALYI